MNTERIIPGLPPLAKGREYRYVADDGSDYFARKNRQSKKQYLFEKLTWRIVPPIPQNGGAMTEKCKLWLPTNELFHALSYRGDIEGWRKQIEQGAEQLGLLTGKIVGENIELSDGRIYALSSPKAEKKKNGIFFLLCQKKFFLTQTQPINYRNNFNRFVVSRDCFLLVLCYDFKSVTT